MFQVDDLQKYSEATTKEFGNYDDAISHAKTKSWNEQPIGVWSKENGELLAIVYHQEVFLP